MEEDPKPKDSKLRVLSLDGGGVRGFSSLLIVERIMQSVRRLRNSPDEPHQVFDITFGTSAGGLNAIMLGRLQMSMDACIESLLNVSRTVFTGGWTLVGYLRRYGNRYSEQTMCDAIKTIAHAEDLMHSPSLPRCWVVCRESNSSGRVKRSQHRAICLANFQNGQPNCKILEAGRATSAAPTFFPPQSIIGNPTRFFVDGGLRFNNPIMTFTYHYKSQDLKHYDEECYVSVGTGIPEDNENDEDTRWWRILSAFGPGAVNDAVAEATDARNDADSFELWIEARSGRKIIRHYRFDCPHGLGSIALDGVDQLSHIATLTNCYLTQSEPKINDCAAALS